MATTEELLDKEVKDTSANLTAASDETQKQVGLLSTPTTASYVAPTVAEKETAGAVVKDASTYSTPETTVAGQLNTLLGSDSEYMKQAAAKSKLTANELGMLSSDRYIGAAQGAAIREALPIATADANTASAFSKQQQTADTTLANTALEGLVSGSLKQQEATITTQLKKTQAALDATLAAGAAKNSAELAGLNNKLSTTSSEALKNLDAKLQAGLLNQEYSKKTAENARAQATSQIENAMITIENTIKDPDVLQLGAAAMSKIVNNEIALMRSGIELTYNLAGLNVDGYISDLLDSFSKTYTWK